MSNLMARVNNLLMKVSLRGDDVLEGAALMQTCSAIFNTLKKEKEEKEAEEAKIIEEADGNAEEV